MITRNFNLYLNAGHSVPLVINVNQYDSGEQWVFTLYNSDGTQYTPSTGAIVGIKSDGLGIINSGSVVDGKVVINETQQMTAAVGKAVFELLIDSQTHGTANFIVLVEEKPGNNADMSESDLSLLQEAIDATSPLPTGGTVGQVLTKTANGSTWSDAGTPTQEQVAEAVSDWADEHITVETGVVIDTSLSVAGAAADAKKTGDEISDLKSALNEVVSDLADETEYDFSTATVNSFYIASSAPNVWAKSSNRHGYIFPVNTSAFKVTITANSDYNVAYAFLKSNSQNSGSAVDYCDDTTRNSILPGESVTAFIPSDCTYMWVLKDFDGENHEPEELSFCIFADVSHFVSFMQEQTIGEAGKEIARNNIGAADSNKLNNLESVVHPINLAEDVTWNDGYAVRHANGTTYTSNNLSASPYIDISSCLQILYSRSVASTTQSVPTSGIAFYDENKIYISGVPSIKADTGGYEDEIEVVPSGAKYARFTKRIDQNYFVLFNYNEQYHDSLTVRVSQLENNEIENNVLGLHTKPDNIGVLNVIKRCRQMTDIKWTPAVDLPRYMYAQSTPPSDSNYNASNVKKYLGVFKAGVEYKGIPYGRADMLDDYGYGYSYVGMNIDFETFVTAVQNPESIISKENVGSVSDHYSIQYASVCSALTCYALGLSAYYATANIPNIPGLNLVSALKVNGEYIDPNTFKLGDVLNKESDHTSVITDIIKDSNGNTVFIEEAEATVNGEANPDYVGGQYGGLCRRVGFNIEDFFARYGEYSLYRYANIGSVTYTPSKFVNVGDEFDMARFSHLPCMPYMGEGFKYKSEYIPNTKIVITTDDYNYLRVFKDGTEITGSPFTVSGSYVETGFSEAGEYVAYLCNMSGGSNTIVSAKCHWSVI